MEPADSTTQLAAPWPPPAPQVAMAIFAATLKGKVTQEEIDAVEGLPPSKFPRELMIKLGYNPPPPACANLTEEHQPNHQPMDQDGNNVSGNKWAPDDMQILFAMRAGQMAGTFSQADADRMDEGPKETWPPDLWAKLGFRVPPDAAPLPQDNAPDEDVVENAWEELKVEGYPKQDSDPATGERFPVYPEEIFYNDNHPLAGTLPDNARPETWRELDSAFFNPSKARSILEQPEPAQTPASVESIDAAIIVAIRSGTLGEQDLAIIRQLPEDEWPESLRLRLCLPAPISAIVEISTSGTFHHITQSHDTHPCEGDEHVMFSRIEVVVSAKDTESESGLRLIDSVRFSAQDGTLGEHAAPPEIPLRGVIDEVGCASRMEREIQIKLHEDLNIHLGSRGISIGSHIIKWSEVTESGGLDCYYDLTAYWDGEVLDQAMTSVLYQGNEKSNHPMRGILLALMDEVGFLSAHGASDAYGHSPAQVMAAAGADPDVLLELAKSLPWDRAKQLNGPTELAVWLDENHPEHRSGQDKDDQDSEWPPDDFRILCAMRARRMAGAMTSKDVDRMDEGPPESWPDDLWKLLGFTPPSQRQ